MNQENTELELKQLGYCLVKNLRADLHAMRKAAAMVERHCDLWIHSIDDNMHNWTRNDEDSPFPHVYALQLGREYALPSHEEVERWSKYFASCRKTYKKALQELFDYQKQVEDFENQ